MVFYILQLMKVPCVGWKLKFLMPVDTLQQSSDLSQVCAVQFSSIYPHTKMGVQIFLVLAAKTLFTKICLLMKQRLESIFFYIVLSYPVQHNAGISLLLPPSRSSWLVGWLVCMLLVNWSGLVKEDAIEVFHFYGFHLSSSFMMYNFKSFQGK